MSLRVGFHPLFHTWGNVELQRSDLQVSNSVRKAIELFGELGITDHLTSVLERKFLPPRKTVTNLTNSHQWDHLLGLCYLSVLTKNLDKHPMTAEQAEKFATSVAYDAKTSRWLGWRAWLILGLTSAAAACIPLFSLTQFKEDNEENLHVQVGMTMTASLVSAFVFGAYGLLWTGVYPNQSSIKANDKQNAMVSLRNDFENMAHHLINLSFDQKELAQLLAGEIDILYIRHLLEKYSGESNVDELTNLYLIEQAILFVRDGQTPTHPALKMAIDLRR